MEKLKGLASKIRWFIMDVDGVLTDGSIVYDSDGREIKRFCVKDGIGINLLHNVGIKTAFITSRSSSMVEKRGKELKITEIIQGASDKLAWYEKVKEKYHILDDEILYIGDDFVDLPVLRKVGFPVTVPDAPDELKEICVYVTQKQGGDGAVREVAELLLKLSGKFEEAVRRYTD